MQPLHSKRDPIASDEEAALAHVQADILQHHACDHATLLFVGFGVDAVAFRSWLGRIGREVTTAADQLAAIRKAVGPKGRGTPTTTVSLAWAGYQLLGLDDPAKFVEIADNERPDHPFRDGMPARDALRHDPPQDLWAEDLRQRTSDAAIHALVSLADPDWSALRSRVARLIASLPTAGRIVARRDGHALKRNGHNIEHFGFRDGISQPLFLAREIAEAAVNGSARRWNPAFGPGLVLRRDPYGTEADCGSLLVFRQLAQDVPGFLRHEAQLADMLGATDAPGRERVEAMIVGRTRDGVPLVGTAPDSINDFDFNDDDAMPLLCPAHAHIRKANPRRDMRVGDRFRERILARRSITYGVDPESLLATTDASAEVGLLFMCYQRNITRQFEFIQQHWLDDDQFPTPNAGVDPVTGTAPRQPLEWSPASGAGPQRKATFASFVTLRGGGYYFTPSPGFLKSLA